MPNTRIRSRLQNGQAIVLIALLILVLFGMLGLAIDSGRAYVDRRDQQAAVDAAALAAGDWYDNYNDVTNYAVPNAVQLYANDLRLYGGVPAPSGPFLAYVGPTGALPQYTWTYNWPTAGYTLTVVATNTLFNGYQFLFTTYHDLPLAFMQIFGGSPTVSVQAQAGSIVRNQRQNPAILTLSTMNCSLNLKGGATLTILGDAYSNGTACVDPNLQEAGNCYGAANSTCSSATYFCYNSTPGFTPYAPNPTCHAGDVQGQPVVPAPTLPDPLYQAPSVGTYSSFSSYSQYNRGTWTEMYPGQYAGLFHLTGGSASCAFLDGGVYTWVGGYTSDANGSLLSNELKAPDEGLWSAPGTTNVANPQFWNQNGVGCAGDFNLTMVPTPGGNGIAEKGSKIKTNQWGVELTSVRYDTFNDNVNINPDPCFGAPGCVRESAPSECQLTPGNITNNGTTGVNVNITRNAPGAQYYNVYLDVNGCDGVQTNFGFYGRFLAPGFSDAGGTPTPIGPAPYMGGFPPASPVGTLLNPYPAPASPITLGYTAYQPAGVASIMNFNHFGAFYTPFHCASLSRVQPCQPPDVEGASQCFSNCVPPPTGLSQENAATQLQPTPFTGGDEANENYCVSQGAATQASPCFGATVTPGGVQFYMPAGACMTQNAQGATYVFAGIQYNWIAIYQPASNTCNNTMNGGAYTQYIGTIYTPGANWTLNGGNRAPLAGQVICFTAFVAGGASVGIDYNPNYSPAPPAARLIA